MFKYLLFLLVSFSAYAAAPLSYKGHIVKVDSKYYFIKEYLAIQPRYLIEFAKGQDMSRICLANKKSGCPYYTISIGAVKAWDKTSKFTDVRIVAMDFEREP